MNNVISFPRRIEAKQRATTRKSQPMTLFVHVKRATLIVHLADTSRAVAAGRASTN